MGASTIPSTYLLPELLPAYKKLCPETYFNIHQNDSQGILDKILEGSFNLGLVGMTSEDDRFCFEPFYQDQMVLITQKNHYFQKLKDNCLPIEQILQTEDLILREEGSGSRKFVCELLEKLNIPESSLQVTARLNDQSCYPIFWISISLGRTRLRMIAITNTTATTFVLSFIFRYSGSMICPSFLIPHQNFRIVSSSSPISSIFLISAK